eukprot:SAG11_NODE_1731_length_4363_cov_4.183865_1_plen_408_part_00
MEIERARSHISRVSSPVAPVERSPMPDEGAVDPRSVWFCRRFQYRVLGSSIGVIIPSVLAALLWSAKAVKDGEEGVTLGHSWLDSMVLLVPDSNRSSTLGGAASASGGGLPLGRALEVMVESPVMTVCSAVLFGALFGVFGLGASLQLGVLQWFSPADRDPDAPGRARASTSAELKTAGRKVNCTAFIALLFGVLLGVGVVLLVLVATPAFGSVMLGVIVGAGVTCDPYWLTVSCLKPSQTAVFADRCPLGLLIGNAVQAAGNAETMSDSSSCMRGVSCCTLSLAKCCCCLCSVYSARRPATEPPRPSARMLVAWVVTLLFAAAFGAVAFVSSLVVADTTEVHERFFSADSPTTTCVRRPCARLPRSAHAHRCVVTNRQSRAGHEHEQCYKHACCGAGGGVVADPAL